MLSRYSAALAAVVVGCLLAADASAVRLVTYNLLNYTSGRDAEFRHVMNELQADVLVVQEIGSQTAVNNFLNSVLLYNEPGEWEAGPFVNGYDSDNAIFFRSAVIDDVTHFRITTTLRDIDEWTVQPVGYESAEAGVRIYVVHLKASQGSTNEQRRLDEVTDMRQRMETYPPGQNYIVAGDFNIYRSSEPAYVYMLSTDGGPAGVVVDPLGVPGSWHDHAGLAWVHTQSPRTVPFGGGATGGLDDRFDQLLVSPTMMDEEGFDYIDDSYISFGNDGQHFNIALIDPPDNGVVSQETVEALYYGSDHLPVYADFQLPAILVADSEIDFGSVIVGGSAEELLSVANGATIPADELDYSLSAPPNFTAPTGDFAAYAGAPANTHTIGMLTGSAGFMSGDLIISSDAPDALSHAVALSGSVLDHGKPSVDPDVVIVAGTIDFGTHAPDGFVDQAATVYNVDYGTYQALVDVHAAEITGDPRFDFTTTFSPALVGDEPVSWDVHFDASGAEDGIYSGTLSFHTRDQQDLSGAIDLSDLVFDLVATVDGEAIDVAQGVTGPTRVGIIAIGPNPHYPTTTIRYGLADAGPVSVSIYDVAGRLVRTLVNDVQGRGDHAAVWQGENAMGRRLGSGTYYVRLMTDDVTETQAIVRIR